VTRKVLLWALVVVMPFGGMRVMCVEAPLAATTAAVHAHDSDCERLCPLPPAVANSGNGSDCAMTVDNSLIIMAAAVAVFPVQPPLAHATFVQHEFADPSRRYLEPWLAQPNPPPEA
jgi:hypothetical protein